MKKVLLLVLALTTFQHIVAQSILVEDYSGLSIGNLGTQNGWTTTSGTKDVQVASASPITFSGVGYPSGGNEYVTISPTSVGTSPYKIFSAITLSTSSTIYFSFLVSVTNAPDTTGDYFISLRNSAGAYYGARIFARQGSTSSNVRFGISKAGASADAYTGDYNLNITYLLVVKYVSVSGSTNDQLYLWVYSNETLPSSAPADNTATLTATTGNADPRFSGTVDAFNLLQRSTSTIGAKIDGIRVATDWSQAPLPVVLTSFTSNVVDNKVILNWTTATEVNNNGFEVQRSAVNSQMPVWEKIGFVQGSGNSNLPKNYSFTDEPTGGKEFQYRLKQIDFDGTFEYSEITAAVLENVSEFKLDQNFPNPFNPATRISYTLPVRTNVKLRVYNLLAQMVAELSNGIQEAGRYEVTFDGSNLPSGAYFYKLEAGNYVEVKKLLLIK